MSDTRDLVAMHDGLLRYIEWHGGIHDDGCPQDDTCGCSGKPINEAVNATARYLAALTTPAGEGPQNEDDKLGLSIDMLDVDRLRQYAQNLLTYGPDITHWASLPHVVKHLQTIATNFEQAVRDIGTLRALRAAPVGEGPQDTPICACTHAWEAHTGHTVERGAMERGEIPAHCSQGCGCMAYRPAYRATPAGEGPQDTTCRDSLTGSSVYDVMGPQDEEHGFDPCHDRVLALATETGELRRELAALRAAGEGPQDMAWYANRADGGADWKCKRCGRYTTFFGDNHPWCPACDKQPPAAPSTPQGEK